MRKGTRVVIQSPLFPEWDGEEGTIVSIGRHEQGDVATIRLVRISLHVIFPVAHLLVLLVGAK